MISSSEVFAFTITAGPDITSAAVKFSNRLPSIRLGDDPDHSSVIGLCVGSSVTAEIIQLRPRSERKTQRPGPRCQSCRGRYGAL